MALYSDKKSGQDLIPNKFLFGTFLGCLSYTGCKLKLRADKLLFVIFERLSYFFCKPHGIGLWMVKLHHLQKWPIFGPKMTDLGQILDPR